MICALFRRSDTARMKDKRIALFADSKYNVTLWGSPLQLRNTAQFELPKLIRDSAAPPDSVRALINTEPLTHVCPLHNKRKRAVSRARIVCQRRPRPYHLRDLPHRAVNLRVRISLQASNPQAGAHLRRPTVPLQFLFHKHKRRSRVPHYH